MSTDNAPAGLTAEGCRSRQNRLRERLAEQNLDAALILDPRHVYYFTGYFSRRIYFPVVLIERAGPTRLSVPAPCEMDVAADEVAVHVAHRIGTLVDDQTSAALEPLQAALRSAEKLGSDVAISSLSTVDLGPTILALRRSKDSDEVAFLLHIIRGTEAAYQFAADELSKYRSPQHIRMSELDLFAGMQRAAISYLGEAIGEFGNDFQIGSLGSAPRRRVPKPGELAVLDLTIECRGYRSDMCRTFAIGTPSERQKCAHARVLEVIAEVEQMIRSGVKCRDVFDEARAKLDGYEGWSFPHHLGHGIGLSQHEAPRLNPHWDDVFQPGDVFTVEPGLYAPELRAGVRVEQVYLLTESGLTRLTSFPTRLGG